MKRRLFIALPVDRSWRKTFEHYRDQYGDVRWLRWTPLPDLHLTLQFIGEVDEEAIPEIENAMEDIANFCRQFELVFDHIGYGPPESRASMVWGYWKMNESYEEIASMLRDELSLIVPVSDDQKDIAHITLARFDIKQPPPRELVHLKRCEREGETIAMRKMMLFESILPKGGSRDPLYRELRTFQLLGTL